MKIAYDIPTPKKKHNAYGHGRFSKVFWEFYESEHQNVRVEFEDEEECKKAHRSYLNLMSRNNIHDLALYRDKEKILLVKAEADDE